ncbi:Protein kinase-like domain [Pseudocohnilembus persalinus]|uniref:Protein kinase-like domain n=1 Tax=Pseudocohnilembus persalinus TaxID=266149 RepID=A0A0V0QLL7_PSEPJ|nr:Protein kinase-like domain [Pseudocohnilembus persalinus]|eukprot:KRX03241.1 Protein kinase-like domain [Pseudocohnilembus persalinus]
MSPEIQLRQAHDHKSDIWSLGVVLYFMMFRSFPFKSKGNRLNEIYKACTPEFDLRKHLGNNQYNFKFSQDLVDFFKLIFAYDPNQRISFSYLFSCNKLIQKYLNGSKINEATNFYKGLEQKNIKERVPQQLVEQDKYQQKRKSQNINVINPANSIINEENEPDICIEQHQDTEDNLPNQVLKENKNSRNYLHNQKILNNEENLKEIDEEGKAYKLNNFRNVIENIDQNNESDIKTEVKKMLENIIGPKLQRKCTPDSNSQLSEITSSCRKGLKKLAEIDIKNQTLKQQYQQIYTTYLFRIQKYNFIGDVLNLLPNLNLPQNTDLVSHYVLCKLLLFYALKLRNSLMHQQNIFKLEGFSSFVESKYKEKLIDKINFDILRWNSKFVMFYYSIDTEMMIKSEKLKSLITMEAPQYLIIDSIHQVVQAAYGLEKLKSIQQMCENNDNNNINYNHSDNNYQSNINNQLSNKNGNFE